MKYAICNETFQGWEFLKACEFCRALGYNGIELAPFTFAPTAGEISPKQRAEIAQHASSSGLQVVGLHWLLAKTEGFHITTADAAVRTRTAQYLAELAALCRDVGGSLMVLGSPQQRNIPNGVTQAQAFEHAQEVIQKALPAFEKHHVTLALEPLGPSEGNFLLTAAEAVRLIKAVDSPFVQLHLDCKAMSSEAIPIPELLKAHRHEMIHFHANDPNRQGPGFGDLDFHPILSALHEIQYSGWISVEVFDYSPGVEALASKSIEYLKSCEPS